MILLEFVVIGLHLADFPKLRCDAVDVISGPIAEVKVVHQGGKIGGGIGGGAHGRAVDDLEVLVDLDGVELHLQGNVNAKRMPNDVAIAAVPLLLLIKLHFLHYQREFSHHELHLVLHQTVGFWGDDLLAEIVQSIRRAFDLVVEVRIVGAGLHELESGVYGFPVVDQVVMVTLVFRLLDVRPQHRHILSADLQRIEQDSVHVRGAGERVLEIESVFYLLRGFAFGKLCDEEFVIDGIPIVDAGGRLPFEFEFLVFGHFRDVEHERVIPLFGGEVLRIGELRRIDLIQCIGVSAP